MSDITPERALAIVDDETIRQRVRKQLSADKTHWFKDLLRHPLTSLILGFALTGVLGALFTQRIAADREDALRNAEAKRVKVEAALASTQEFARLIYERQGRAALLLAALHRNADPEELRERKLAYDKSFIDWERNIKANLLTIRTASGWRGFSPFEEVVEDHLIPSYQSLDSALTSAYDNRRRRRPTGDLRRAESVLASTRVCSNKITDSLYGIIPVFEEQEGIPEGLKREMIRDCTNNSAVDSVRVYWGAP